MTEVDDLVEHPFSRTELLIGSTALRTLQTKRVAVFGVGGVGSYAVEALARSGVGHLVLVDHDSISLTNLNRQMHALQSTLGQAKVLVMKQRIKEINPQAQVDIHQIFFTAEQSALLFQNQYDYIIDAVDTVAAKVELAVQATARKIPLISSMGAGNKLDPTLFQVADIYSTSVCPLARVMRRELRARNISELKTVFSPESPAQTVLGETGRPIPGSISFVPSVAGLIAAGEVIKDLIKA